MSPNFSPTNRSTLSFHTILPHILKKILRSYNCSLYKAYVTDVITSYYLTPLHDVPMIHNLQIKQKTKTAVGVNQVLNDHDHKENNEAKII